MPLSNKEREAAFAIGTLGSLLLGMTGAACPRLGAGLMSNYIVGTAYSLAISIISRDRGLKEATERVAIVTSIIVVGGLGLLARCSTEFPCD